LSIARQRSFYYEKKKNQSTSVFKTRWLNYHNQLDLTPTGDAKNSPLSGAGKHPDFQVTLCHCFVTINTNFAYIESEIMPFF
jgi:hypothetical protein